MALFSRKKSTGDSGESTAGDASVESFKRDERKAQKWFKHARVAADQRNYDYSVECYISGLRFDPDNMTAHEELREVSLKRKVSGGKPPSFSDKMKRHGKDPVGKMLDPARLTALDPLNRDYLAAFVERATEVGETYPELNMAEVVYWLAEMAIAFNRDHKKPDKKIFLQVMACCKRLQIWGKAIDACRAAIQLDPTDAGLIQELKDLEAENVMREGGYDQTDKDFKGSVKDMDAQRALGDEDSLSKTGDAIDAMVKRRRTEYEEDPHDIDRLLKLVAALKQRETPEAEQEAIKVLKEALEQTGQYRFKAEIGNIRMKAMARHLRKLRKEYDASPNDAAAKQAFIEGTRQLLAFELQEYEERVKNYPTDMTLRFHYGRRLFQAHRYDEAIGALQQAKADPKVRALATSFLGQAYMKQQWYDEAIETLEAGVSQHPLTDDQMGMDLRYHLMDAYEQKARQEKSYEMASKAVKLASQLLQTDIGYRDIKSRITKIRALAEELKPPK